MTTVISVENLSKTYRLGQIGTGTFTYDLSLWWAKIRDKPNPMLKIGQTDHGNRDGEELWALKDVRFKVEQGEVLGIIGRNGAGKSTLLKILSRVTAPTSGRVKVKGRIASLLEVGTGFHPELTGRENIYLNGAILGMNRKEIDRKFDEIVNFAEVEKFIDTPVKRYSSGMYVRLAFAVAAHLEPEILVVDEVLAVGDAEFQKKCLGKMGDVAKEGRTVLFVSHNMGSIKNLCSSCVLLNSGQIESIGDTNLVISQYSSPVSINNPDNFLNLSRRAGTTEVAVKNVRIVINSSEVDGAISFNSEIKFEIEVLARENIINASIFLLIKSAVGEYLLSPFQRDTDQTFNLRKNEECIISATLTNNLMPGAYFVDIGIFDQYFHFYDWIESATTFTIAENAKLHGRLGYITPDTKWNTIKKESHTQHLKGNK